MSNFHGLFSLKNFNLNILHSLESLIFTNLAVETSEAGEPVCK
jgi:hypothetical protein